MMRFFKKTVPANDSELELMGLLQEENGEVVQIVSKVRRFGLESKNPFIPGSKTNRVLMEDEIGDVFAIVALMVKEGTINMENIHKRVEWKIGKLREQGYAPPS